ncbi:hypothetical protein [Actinoplanes sp. NBRC 101535]|uniref:hypothetical protein n=1 Tax=Actinoplanes sp. NBRC 101535 TaxID=3032196 RepID=UPI0024A3C96B|nr:hypothetical protein [Actinoplanes sp. NBRC 101535]GLY01386.1 hypothetical protein Acsp01_17650 [Actinoplanes sp. NBRC 101535]
MTGPSPVERLAAGLLARAARRWPDDLAEVMLESWIAELATMRGTPGRMLRFAGSILVAPPVEEEGADPVTWGSRASSAARTGTAALLTVLVAATLFNGVHLALHHGGPLLSAAGETVLVIALLTVSALLMAGAAARWAPRRRVRATLATGVAAYAFLLAGNEVAVMPFMGWPDIAPAVVTWTAIAALTTVAAGRLARTGRHRLAGAVAVLGGLLSVVAGTAAGALHAAAVLGIPAVTAPAWLPLALLPGAAARPGFDVLPANAAAMAGPLLLCTVFLTTATVRAVRSAGSARPVASRRAGATARVPHRIDPVIRRADPAIMAGAITAGVVLLLADLLPRLSPAAEHTASRLADNSAVFGFGFLASPAARIALAFALALLAAHHATRPSPAS